MTAEPVPEMEMSEPAPTPCAGCGTTDRAIVPLMLHLALDNAASWLNKWLVYMTDLHLCHDCTQTMVSYSAGPPDPYGSNRRWYTERDAFVSRIHVAMLEQAANNTLYLLDNAREIEKRARNKARRR